MTACLRLDDYLDGRLSDADADAFETHALDCAACDVALADALDLSPLGDVICPPAVVDAALRSARRAPDRAPVARRSVRRFVWAPLALVAALAVVVGVSLDRGSAPPEIAEAVEPVRPADEAAAATDSNDAAPNTAPAPPPVAQAVPDEAPAAPVRQAPRPERRPVAAPSAPAPSSVPDAEVAEAVPTEPSDAEPSDAEIEAARQDLALAFRLVADAQSRAGDAVRAEAGALSSTFDHTLPF